ncbi:MAG: hypothetical protein AMS24_00455 [Chlamydiae bacterium SM23_39]|nr:MAG: hypothetical protein AMS24_00455 [Chlamydiae bacterium SM23_39]
MTDKLSYPTDIFQKTRNSILSFNIFNEIFVAFFGLMPFILRKDLLASAFQISLFTMMKPAVAVLSFYWSSKIIRTKEGLKYNVVIGGILARIPFLFFPFFKNIWYMIFASAMYMLFSRASIPAWMEILKLNLDKNTRQKFFSLGSVLAYAEGVLIALLIGSFLDSHVSGWKTIFVVSTIFGLVGVFFQFKAPIFGENIVKNFDDKKKVGIIKPWKEGFDLLKKRKDFLKFQIGTFFSGFGIMLAMPALALFYVDNLSLSHTDMTIGRYIFMGLGFVFFSPLWAKLMNRFSVNFLTGYVCIGFALFPLCIFFALFSKIWFYIAFLFYGITQGGSHLIWNLSGTLFAKDEDSSKFTRMNVSMVGIRGLIAPLLGGVLCEIIGPIILLFISGAISLFGSFCMFRKKIYFFQKESF